MFLAILLTATTAITPQQSVQADEVARAYLTRACADGGESIVAVTAADGVLHDLSQNRTANTVTMDEAALRSLCRQTPLILYHCHPTDDQLSLFPGLGLDRQASDFGTVAYVEYLCASGDTLLPTIEHRIVHTGGDGTVVRFGLRGATLEWVRALGREVAAVEPDASPTVNRYGMPDLRPLVGQITTIQKAYGKLQDLYDDIFRSYRDETFAFIRGACPNVKSLADLQACTAFNAESFVRTMEPCADRFIILPTVATRDCTVATGPRITLDGPRYPGWTELTPESYDTFTRAKHAVVAFCSDSDVNGQPRCETALSELDRQLPTCGTLARGFVDADRHPELRQRHDARWQNVILLEEGRKYTINARTPSRQLLELIVCGPDELFRMIAQ